MSSDWISVTDRLPPLNVAVETKIDDEKGCRNVQQLMQYQRGENTKPLMGPQEKIILARS